MIRYFTALIGVGAIIGMEPGSDALLAGIVLPVIAFACAWVVLGGYATILICIGIWLVANINLTSSSMLNSALYPALLMADGIALIIWAAQRGILRGAWRDPRLGGGFFGSDNE